MAGIVNFVLGAGLVAGGVGAGCAFSLELPSVGGPEMEKRLTKWLREEGIGGSVTCPKRVRKVGDVFSCDGASSAGGPLSVTVKVHEDSVGWKIERLIDTKSILSRMHEKLGEAVTLSCRERYLQLPADGGAASCEIHEKSVPVGKIELRHNAANDGVDIQVIRFEADEAIET